LDDSDSPEPIKPETVSPRRHSAGKASA
jgi:hypothetical protein